MRPWKLPLYLLSAVALAIGGVLTGNCLFPYGGALMAAPQPPNDHLCQKITCSWVSWPDMRQRCLVFEFGHLPRVLEVLSVQSSRAKLR
jgi:hypothetical protein